MQIIKLLKTNENKFEVILLNKDLIELCDKETFQDMYTLNFYLQSMQKKLNFYECLVIIHDKYNNNVELIKNNGEIFIIQNPPSAKEELIELIEKMNDTLNLNSIAKNKKNYTQYFYKETFNLTRFYKPYYTSILGNYVDIINDINGDFDEEYLASYNYKYQNNENHPIEWLPIYPYYAFYKEGSIDYEYYPKGLKDNPNIHWKNYDSE